MKVNKDNFNSSKLKNNSLLSRFLNDKKSRIRCKFDQLATLKHVDIYSAHSI